MEAVWLNSEAPMTRAMTMVVGALILVTVGCGFFVQKESAYLRTARGKATQQEVRAHMGQPRSVTASPTGESLWLYEIRDLEPMSQSSWSTLGSWCDEYRLTFDRSGILQDWSHVSYVHGGELMPASCNSTLGVQKPAL